MKTLGMNIVHCILFVALHYTHKALVRINGMFS